MAKTFNVEQLRLNGFLLTGSNTGSLHYNGQQLAMGGNAVPTSRRILLGDGMAFKTGVSYLDQADLSVDRNLILHLTDHFAFDNSNPGKLEIADEAVSNLQLNPNAFGAGLEGGGAGNTIKVVGGSGLLVGNVDGKVNINVSGVQNSMLSGQITDDKLNQITTTAKVKGGAVTLESNGGLDTGSAGGLQIESRGVVSSHIHSDMAGAGLVGGNNGSTSTAFSVGAGSGIQVNADDVNIKPGGVITSMIADTAVTDAKLATITGFEKVDGYAVSIAESGGLKTTGEGGGLMISGQGVSGLHLHADVAGNGLTGAAGNPIHVAPGSGLVATADEVGLAETGIQNIHIKNGTIEAGKLAGGIGLSNNLLSLTWGDGLSGNTTTNDISVLLDDTRPGLEFNVGKLQVDDTVVRGDQTSTQTLSGNYSFKNDLTCLSGLVINGDLEVRGDTLVTEQNQVNIGDTIVVLNANYTGSAPPDAGIEVERGTHTNASVLFDDDSTNKWQAGINGNLYRIETQEWSRSYSVEMASGVNQYRLPFGHTFDAIPNCTVSLAHTGKHGITNADLMGAMITKVYTTGVFVDFTANTNNSGYYLNVQAVMP